MGKRSIIMIAFVLAALLLASPVCLAAGQTGEKPSKLTVSVELGDKYFWTYPYITTDGKIRKPSAVVVEWSIGTSSKTTKQTVMVPDKTGGDYDIVTDRGAIVNIQVTVVDATNTPLGGGSMQVRNNGQKERFYVNLPDSTSPAIVHDTGRPE